MTRSLLAVVAALAALELGCDSTTRPTSMPPTPQDVQPWTATPAPPLPRLVDAHCMAPPSSTTAALREPHIYPRACDAPRPLTVMVDPAGFRLRGSVRNDGDLCGTGIEGHWYFSSGHTIHWTLDPAVMLRPGDTVAYEACCLPRSVAGQPLTYTGLLKADPIACPG